MSSAHGKSALRAEALQQRAKIAPDVASAFARRLERLGPELARARGARSVSAYWSIGDEIPTEPLIRALHAAGFAVGLPVTGRRGTPLTFRHWTPETVLVPGRMDIPEPPATADVIKPDLLFVPLAAFDRRGHRIGYGGGFSTISPWPRCGPRRTWWRSASPLPTRRSSSYRRRRTTSRSTSSSRRRTRSSARTRPDAAPVRG